MDTMSGKFAGWAHRRRCRARSPLERNSFVKPFARRVLAEAAACGGITRRSVPRGVAAGDAGGDLRALIARVLGLSAPALMSACRVAGQRAGGWR